jgi:hypothetical protein
MKLPLRPSLLLAARHFLRAYMPSANRYSLLTARYSPLATGSIARAAAADRRD